MTILDRSSSSHTINFVLGAMTQQAQQHTEYRSQMRQTTQRPTIRQQQVLLRLITIEHTQQLLDLIQTKT